MPLAYTTLDVYRGDTYTQKLTFTDPGATPEDPRVPRVLEATGWTAQLRESTESDTVIAEFEVITTEAADGILYLHLGAEASAACSSGSWDLQHATDDAVPVVTTYARGPFLVDPDVTRA